MRPQSLLFPQGVSGSQGSTPPPQTSTGNTAAGHGTCRCVCGGGRCMPGILPLAYLVRPRDRTLLTSCKLLVYVQCINSLTLINPVIIKDYFFPHSKMCTSTPYSFALICCRLDKGTLQRQTWWSWMTCLFYSQGLLEQMNCDLYEDNEDLGRKEQDTTPSSQASLSPIPASVPVGRTWMGPQVRGRYGATEWFWKGSFVRPHVCFLLTFFPIVNVKMLKFRNNGGV